MEMWKHCIAIVVSVIYCFIAIAKAAELITFSKEYDPFVQSYYEIFEIVSPPTITQLASFEYEPTQLASFNISFLISVFWPLNGSAAEGMAFAIAQDLLVPPNSLGQFLGPSNSMTDGSDSNKLVALMSTASDRSSENLTPHNIMISPIGVKFHIVWVDYDGLNKVIYVYIKEETEKDGATSPKPHFPVLSADLNLRDHVSQYSYFGFSASSGNDSQVKSVLRWHLTVQFLSDPGKKADFRMKIILGAGVAALLVVVAAFVGYQYFHNQKLKSSRPNLVGALKCLLGMPRKFK